METLHIIICTERLHVKLHFYVFDEENISYFSVMMIENTNTEPRQDIPIIYMSIEAI